MAAERTDCATIGQAAAGARNELELIESSGLDETRALLAAGRGDLVVLDAAEDGASLKLVHAMAADPQLASVPIVFIGADMAADAVVTAMRAGVADVLNAEALTPDALDQAVETAMRRAQGTRSDQRAMISNLRAENETLRRVTARNMRLMKGEAMPLMSLAWRFAAGETLAEDERARIAKGLARITRNVTGLIDDTVITAATHRANAVDQTIVLNELVDQVLQEDLGEISASRAHIVVLDLPVLRARRAHMEMLFEELLLTAVRHGRIGRVPEIEIGSGVDPDGNPIIVFTERGLQLSARKQGLTQRGQDIGSRPEAGGVDPHAWSLCQRLVEKNNGRLQISDSDGQGTRLMMRFPRAMLVAPAAAT